MSKKYYKGYWMMTNRCNLACSYCVLENSPEQLRQELNLAQKKQLISHLYENLNFRHITLSGGEVLIMGKHPPKDFLEIMKHIRSYKDKQNKINNLNIEVYSNATYLTEDVADAMEGVVDQVAITVDSKNNAFLKSIGRIRGKRDYIENLLRVVKLLNERHISLKLHSVVFANNIQLLPNEIEDLYSMVAEKNCTIDKWKFYQYMSYDDEKRDEAHRVSNEDFMVFEESVKQKVNPSITKLHFKSNLEMNQSLFNILSYGNAQYMNPGDTWTSSKRTDLLLNYQDMHELFEKNTIDKDFFHQYHELTL